MTYGLKSPHYLMSLDCCIHGCAVAIWCGAVCEHVIANKKCSLDAAAAGPKQCRGFMAHLCRCTDCPIAAQVGWMARPEVVSWSDGIARRFHRCAKARPKLALAFQQVGLPAQNCGPTVHSCVKRRGHRTTWVLFGPICSVSASLYKHVQPHQEACPDAGRDRIVQIASVGRASVVVGPIKTQTICDNAVTTSVSHA